MASRPPGRATRVRLVTLEDCHICDQVRAVLGHLAAAFPLAIEDIPFDSPAGKALVVRHRILFPPGLFLDDEYIGFGRITERRLRAWLVRRG